MAATVVITGVSHSRRPEVWVGTRPLRAIIAYKFAPGLLNRYLGEIGYSQMTGEPADPQAPDNLFEPLPGDYGAHGRFDDRAVDTSFQLRANRHRAGSFGAAGLALGIAAAYVLASRTRLRVRAATD